MSPPASRSIAPVTPVRPPRRTRQTSNPSLSSLPPLTPDTDDDHHRIHSPTSHPFDTPLTPPTPVPSSFHPHASRRKSTASIGSSRRKPVPVSIEDNLALVQLQSGRSAHAHTPSSSDPFRDTTPSSSFSPSRSAASDTAELPPRYVLDVAPPTAYSEEIHTGQRTTHPNYIECGLPVPSQSGEQLPVYAEDVQTEPETLARKCWLWGFLFPLLWIIGMAILCIPLKPIEEEEDVNKAQKLEEMIVILREVELKYARRCAWSFAVFTSIISIAVVLAIVVPRFT